MLEGGLRVVAHEDRGAGRVAVVVAYAGGASADPPGKAGLAHLVEHLLFRGGYDEALARIGATSNAWTDHDRLVTWAAAAPEHLGALLDLEAGRFTGVTEEEVRQELRVVAEEASGRDLLPERLAARLWPGHPYGRPVLAPLVATLDEVRAFPLVAHTLVVAGELDATDALATVRAAFGEGPIRRELPAIMAPDPAVSGGEGTVVAWRTVPQAHADRPALDLLAAMRGADTRNGPHGGSFAIVADTERDLRRARRALRRTAGLDEARRDMALRWATAIDGVVGRATSLATCSLATGVPDCLPGEWAAYAAVTDGDLRRVGASLAREPDARARR